jgi:hypothetical protein
VTPGYQIKGFQLFPIDSHHFETADDSGSQNFSFLAFKETFVASRQISSNNGGNGGNGA